MLHVIGIGSPFGDDQIGWLLIDELRRAEWMQPCLGRKLELHQFDRPGAGLLAQLEGRAQVVIIDAVVTDGVVGRLHRWSDAAMLEQCLFSSSSHGFGLAQSLALGRALGVLPPQLLILGVEIAPPEVGAGLSPQLRQQLPLLLERVAGEIAALL